MDWTQLPEFVHETPSGSGLPFDIDKYVNERFEKEKKRVNEIYKTDYATRILNDFDAELKKEKRLYNQHYERFMDQFKKDLDSYQKQSTIRVEIYGPDVEFESNEEMLRDKALENFYFVLENKKYAYTTNDEVNEISDFMSGRCKQCTRYIRIKIKS